MITLLEKYETQLKSMFLLLLHPY